MTTTATTYGAKFSEQAQADGIYGYINGGDYTPDQSNRLCEVLLDALWAEVNVRLPEGVGWQPATSEFLLPCDNSGRWLVELPDAEAMGELFVEAWAAVEARYAEIEKIALGN